MINSRKEFKASQIPGPGQYNSITVSQSKSPAFSIGKSQREKSYLSESPGPGSYNISTVQEIKSCTIGTEGLLSNSYSITPGPGAYDIDTDMQPKAPAFSITSRHADISKNFNPGPGSYTPQRLFKSIKYTIGQSGKHPFRPKQIPGPGSYNSNSSKTGGVVLGSTPRKFLEVDQSTPGPGSYDLPSSLDGPKFSLHGKFANRPNESPVTFI